jgi:hypothetical protein
MKSANQRLIQLGLFAVLTFSTNLIFAQPPGGQGGPRKPPQEALEACKSLSSGQTCSFSASRGTVSGTCWAPEGKPLACKPKDASAGGPASQGQ